MAETTLMSTGHAPGRAPLVLEFDAAALAAGVARLSEVVCEDSSDASSRRRDTPVPSIERQGDDQRHKSVPSPCQPAARALTSCGVLYAGMEIVIVEPDTREHLPEGRVAEIWVRGGCVAAGYFGKEELTREVFGAEIAVAAGVVGSLPTRKEAGRNTVGKVPTTHSCWLRTGDLGFLHEGQLYPCGRLKDMIKLRGRNLYPQDIEAAVAAALSWLPPNGCAAFVVEKDGAEAIGILIEADRAFAKKLKSLSASSAPPPLCGEIESPANPSSPQRGKEAEKAEVDKALGHIRQAVTEECQAAPALIAFTGPAEFPRTTSGKVRRHAAKLIATTPGDARVLFATEFLPLIHDTLLSVLRDQVDGTLTQLDPDAPLTRYGMDSLATVEAALRLERATGRKLPPDLFLLPLFRRALPHVCTQ